MKTLLPTPRRRFIAGAGAATLVLVASGGAVYAATQNDDDRYRTALTEYADVSETLALTGQVAAATNKDVAFQIGGTVSEILVGLGQRVTAGQTIAVLDTGDLDDAVTSAEDALARAWQQLEDHLDAQSSGPSSSSSNGATPADTGIQSTGEGAQDPAVTAAIAKVTTAQRALLQQYDLAQQAQSDAVAALSSAQAVCEPFLNATLDSDDEPSSPDPHENEETEDGGEEPSASDGPTALEALQELLHQCQQSLAQSQDVQETTAAEHGTLNDRGAELDAAVTALQAVLRASQSGSDGQSDSGGLDQDSGSAQQTTGPAATAATVTSEAILADRAAIDSAEAEVAIARRDRALATLTSPVDGTAVFIGMAVGSAVSAGSTDTAIRVQADAGYVVEGTVALSKIAEVQVGQDATVTLPAFAASYPARVSSVGILNVSQTTTPSYTVTLVVDSGDDSLRIGATAQAIVTLSTAEDVLTVPISAVTVNGAATTVTMLRDGQTEMVAVTVGAIGIERVEIVEGLSEGHRVVLADLSLSVADDDSSASTGLIGLGDSGSGTGSPGGRGFPGSGFTPPGG